MGQQQLLLLVFGLIVVAIAILAGLSAFGEKLDENEADLILARNLEIANSAVMWKMKSSPFLGGGTKYTGLNEDGIDKLLMDEATVSGEFAITSATDNTLEITGISLRSSELAVRTYVSGFSIDSTIISYTGAFSLEN